MNTSQHYIMHALHETYMDLSGLFNTGPNGDDIRSVANTLRNIAVQLEKDYGHVKRPYLLGAQRAPSKPTKPEGGEKVSNPVPPPALPPQGQANDVLSKIRAMNSN